MPFDNSRLPETNIGKLREYFGPNGERWCRWITYDGNGRRCLIGAIIATRSYQAHHYLRSAMIKLISIEAAIERNNRQAEIDGQRNRFVNYAEITDKGDIVVYNNGARDFYDITKLLDVAEAIELAEKMELARV